MSCKVSIRSAFSWPSSLGRPVDSDAAFRRACCLAAARVCEMGRGLVWNDMAARMAGLGSSCHAHEVMAALFPWDGGVEGLSLSSDWCDYSVSPGTMVYPRPDVKSRSGTALFPEGSSAQDKVELMAQAGIPSKCLASKWPYRIWLRALARSVFRLVNEFPLYTIDTSAQGLAEAGTQTSSASPVPFFDDGTSEHLVGVFPLCLSKDPDGSSVKTPDDLCVGWTPRADAAGVVKVRERDRWLVTPLDVDFSYNFLGHEADSDFPNSNSLRALWLRYAADVGFTSFADPEDYTTAPALWDRSVFSGSVRRWWRGVTGPELHDPLNPDDPGYMFLKHILYPNWAGEAERSTFDVEFPYHVHSAFVAILDYLESSNVGFALTAKPCNVKADGYREWETRRYVTEVEVTIAEPETEVVSGEASGWELDRQEDGRDDWDDGPICASWASGAEASSFNASSESFMSAMGIGWPRIVVCPEEDPSVVSGGGMDRPRVADMIGLYAGDGAAALEAKLNQALEEYYNDPPTYFTIPLAFDSSFEATRLEGSCVLDWGSFCSSYADYPFPGSSGGCLSGTYWFLKTSKKSSIRSGGYDIAAYVESEAGVPGRHIETPGAHIRARATLHRNANFGRFTVDRVDEGHAHGSAPSGYSGIPAIYFDGAIVFPVVAEQPAVLADDSSGDCVEYEGRLSSDNTPWYLTVSVDDESSYDVGGDSSCLEVVRGVGFVKYLKNVIYPS